MMQSDSEEPERVPFSLGFRGGRLVPSGRLCSMDHLLKRRIGTTNDSSIFFIIPFPFIITAKSVRFDIFFFADEGLTDKIKLRYCILFFL
jgi:hypothetical protein